MSLVSGSVVPSVATVDPAEMFSLNVLLDSITLVGAWLLLITGFDPIDGAFSWVP